jgi:hypothetical protein
VQLQEITKDMKIEGYQNYLAKANLNPVFFAVSEVLGLDPTAMEELQLTVLKELYQKNKIILNKIIK